MNNKLKETYKSIAILYHIHDEGREKRECVGHVASFAETLTDQIDYFYTPNMEFPADQSLKEYDLIFIMGGFGQVFGDDLPEWMVREIAMVTDAVHNKQKIIGICLGAQMLAMIMGAEVKVNDHFECGFFPVSFDPSDENPLLKEVPASEFFWHWHECGFHTPLNAIEIATNNASQKEIFSDGFKGSQGFVNEHILGLQFHPELTIESFDYVLSRVDERETRTKQSQALAKMLHELYLAPLDSPEKNCARDVFYQIMYNFLEI